MSTYDRLMDSMREVSEIKSHHYPDSFIRAKMKSEGDWVRKMRLRCGMTQGQLGKILHYSSTIISQIENGERKLDQGDKNTLHWQVFTDSAVKKNFVENVLADVVTFMDDTWTGLTWEEDKDRDYVIMHSDDPLHDGSAKEINKDAHVDDIAARIVNIVHECKIWNR